MKQFRTQRAGKKAGFTLIEIMAVVLIIGLLIATVGGPIGRALFKGTEVRIKSDIKQIETAISMYNGEFRRYPDSLSDLIDAEPEPFLPEMPYDPWGEEYFYEPPQSGDEYVVGTYGRDGSPGGEGEDADVTNITLKERN